MDALKLAPQLVLPEMILLATVCVNFLVAPFVVCERGTAARGLRNRFGWLALFALGVAALFWWNSPTVPVSDGPFRLDALAWYTRGVMLVAGAVLVLINWTQVDDSRSPESHACLLSIVAGVNLVAAANDLIVLFLALEMISIPTYFFLLLPKRDPAAQEATLKYFLLSIFSSGFFLFGLSWFYGMAGSTNFTAIQAALAGAENPASLKIGLLGLAMALAGLSFRLTAVPFHFYAPDVFQGAPTSAAALLSFVPKVAGSIAMIRLLSLTFSEHVSAGHEILEALTPLLWWGAVITMFVGNLSALLQTDVRRILAYSSIAHAGYMLIGLTVGRHPAMATDGFDALLFYLPVYGCMTLGVFATLIAASRGGRPIESVDDLAGLSQTRPDLALMLAIFFFSLMGLPPTGGFLAKLNLFVAAWSQGTESGQWLAVWLGVNAVIGAGYYLRLVAVMYLRDPVSAPQSHSDSPPLVASVACVLATVGFFFVPGVIWTLMGSGG